jgi:iron uptake system EfeUOB component EfeO/EfeM
MVFPTDPRFEAMKRDLFKLYDEHRPFMLRVQRDLSYKVDANFKQVSIAIDKRISWDKMIKTPFKFKGR